jgi:hypothetical protein
VAFATLQEALQGSASFANTTPSNAPQPLQLIQNMGIPDQGITHRGGSVSTVPITGTLLKADQQAQDQRFFAVCTSAGGIYTCLEEINVSNMKSRTLMSLRRMFVKPVGVEFIHVRKPGHFTSAYNRKLIGLLVQRLGHSKRLCLHLRSTEMRTSERRP